MLTKYLTTVRTTFSPFNALSGKTVRNFLAMLPPNARSSMNIQVTMLGRDTASQPAKLELIFQDGKEMSIDLEKMKIREIEREVDRHSRVLRRAEELSRN